MGNIYVLAGVNGAGKSSVAAAASDRRGQPYVNPDDETRALRHADPRITQAEANSQAWLANKIELADAIARGHDYSFETTLGGNTIAGMLDMAARQGMRVHMIFVGLRNVELHLARVRARVKAGGHDIPEAKIRDRFETSRANLIRLLPHLTTLRVFDNSEEGDPNAGMVPKPVLLLSMMLGKVSFAYDLKRMPAWAQPIISQALEIGR